MSSSPRRLRLRRGGAPTERAIDARAIAVISGVWVATLALGCASGSSSGSGGAGGATSTTSSKSATTASQSATTTSATGQATSSASTTTASSSGTGSGPCDTGAHGSLNPGATAAEIQICQTCVACSQNNQCKSQWQAYASDPDAMAHSMCLQACGSDATCLDNCATQYPNADALLSTAIVCSVCTECTSNCDAAASGCV